MLCIVIYFYSISTLYDLYCNTNTYGCAYMYTVEWDADRIFIYHYVTLNQI